LHRSLEGAHGPALGRPKCGTRPSLMEAPAAITKGVPDPALSDTVLSASAPLSRRALGPTPLSEPLPLSACFPAVPPGTATHATSSWAALSHPGRSWRHGTSPHAWPGPGSLPPVAGLRALRALRFWITSLPMPGVQQTAHCPLSEGPRRFPGRQEDLPPPTTRHPRDFPLERIWRLLRDTYAC